MPCMCRHLRIQWLVSAGSTGRICEAIAASLVVPLVIADDLAFVVWWSYEQILVRR
jgi:hypothetical protein